MKLRLFVKPSTCSTRNGWRGNQLNEVQREESFLLSLVSHRSMPNCVILLRKHTNTRNIVMMPICTEGIIMTVSLIQWVTGIMLDVSRLCYYLFKALGMSLEGYALVFFKDISDP
ncbi:hypothetical protein CEXT_675971 [Caerostris extrusa]|uniref:Uncharacterized protein n=1 Tax=Caerostris extrusa TaxID=172846 RepID=A0AAV4MMJ6_CAEEX|nr:hypothetical protein CEXT_675971 [Caerostris extrusa]